MVAACRTVQFSERRLNNDNSGFNLSFRASMERRTDRSNTLSRISTSLFAGEWPLRRRTKISNSLSTSVAASMLSPFACANRQVERPQSVLQHEGRQRHDVPDVGVSNRMAARGTTEGEQQFRFLPSKDDGRLYDER